MPRRPYYPPGPIQVFTPNGYPKEPAVLGVVNADGRTLSDEKGAVHSSPALFKKNLSIPRSYALRYVDGKYRNISIGEAALAYEQEHPKEQRAVVVTRAPPVRAPQPWQQPGAHNNPQPVNAARLQPALSHSTELAKASAPSRQPSPLPFVNSPALRTFNVPKNRSQEETPQLLLDSIFQWFSTSE